MTAAVSGRIFEDYPDKNTTLEEAISALNDILHVFHNNGTIAIQLLPTAVDSSKEEWSYWSIDLPFNILS